MGDGTTAVPTANCALSSDQIPQEALTGECSHPCSMAQGATSFLSWALQKRALPSYLTPQNLSGRVSACQVSRVLQQLQGSRGDPAVRVSRDMVPPRGTRLRGVSHVPVLAGWTSSQREHHPAVLHHLQGCWCLQGGGCSTGWKGLQ